LRRKVKMSPKVSVIIPTKNAGSKFDSVLKAIFECKAGIELEVIVVDSGSSDNTRTIASRYPVNLIEIAPSRFTHGLARNLGAKSAKGDILVFITQDATPVNQNWLLNLLKNFHDETVAGVYGRQMPENNSSPLERFFLQYLYPEKKLVKQSINPDNCLLTEIFFSNVNSAMRKSVWENNKFDEGLIMSEDQDWAKRVLAVGKKIIYDPESAVRHSHRYTIKEIIQRNFDSGMSLKGLVNAPLKRSVSYEMTYLKSGFLFFLKNRLYVYLLIFPLYEAARLMGFFLGFYNRFLPLSFKKCISQNKTYWKCNSEDSAK